MDIQSEKLYLIEQLAKLKDIDTILKIKEILSFSGEEVKGGYYPDGSKITEDDLIFRAHESNKAIKENRIKSIEQIRKNMKNW